MRVEPSRQHLSRLLETWRQKEQLPRPKLKGKHSLCSSKDLLDCPDQDFKAHAHHRNQNGSTLVSGFSQCTFLSSQSMKNLEIPALFFSDMNWCPLPGNPTSSSRTYSVFTPA